MQYRLSVLLVFLAIEFIHCQVPFESLCSTEVEATGLSSTDGSDEFEIDLYETKFLPDDTILRETVEDVHRSSMTNHRSDF